MKKKTAFFFMLLANIVLLAHTAVYHHHHDSLVCIETSHCEADNETKTDATPEHDHEHDGEKGAEYCVFKQAVILPSHQENNYGLSGFTAHHFLLLHFRVALLCNKLPLFAWQLVFVGHIPIDTSTYSSFVRSAMGLRGPPTV